jgi:hypothetical protein
MDSGVGGWQSCWSVTATTYPRPAERNLWAPRPESRWGLLASDPVNLEQVEQQLRDRLDALGPAPRAELLHVLMLPTSIEPTGSASFGATRRAAPSLSY